MTRLGVLLAGLGFALTATASAGTSASGDDAGVEVPTSAPGDSTSSPRWELPPISIRADPLPDPLGPFPLATTRITGEALARRTGGNLGDLLRPVAGVRVASRGGGGSSGVSIRGATSDQVLVLVDGRRWQTAQGGGADLGTLPLDAVESVEVFRGGASAFWGPDAIGGAVHVRTRPPSPGAVRLRVAGGSHGERSVSAQGSAALNEHWRARGGGRWQQWQGDYEYEDDARGESFEIENADLRRFTGDARLEGPVGRAGRLRLDASWLDGQRGVPGTEEFPTPAARLDDRRIVVGARWSRTAGSRWQPAVDVSWLGRRRAYRDDKAPFGAVNDVHENDRTRVEALLDHVGDHFAVRFAAGTSVDLLDSTTDGRRTRDTSDVRIRASRDFRLASRSVRVMTALRVDGVEGFDAFVTPRVGLLAELTPGLTARASAGLSYRTPSFDELFWPARATAAGNPDLAAERGRDLDVGLSLRDPDGTWRIGLDAFVREIDDLIQWIPGASGVWRPHNVGRATLGGIEWEAAAGLPLPDARRLELAATGSWLRSADRSGEPNVDGRNLVYRPRWTGTLEARLNGIFRGEFEVTLRGVDDVFVTRANTKVLPGHQLWDLRYRRPVGNRMSFDATLLNVSNTTARDFRDDPLPGRTWQFGLAWRRSAS